ncbi:hypothetical protein ABIA16_004571 [Sinorhizobium fredii]
MQAVVFIIVMALPLEAAIALMWFGPLRSERPGVNRSNFSSHRLR